MELLGPLQMQQSLPMVVDEHKRCVGDETDSRRVDLNRLKTTSKQQLGTFSAVSVREKAQDASRHAESIRVLFPPFERAGFPPKFVVVCAFVALHIHTPCPPLSLLVF